MGSRSLLAPALVLVLVGVLATTVGPTADTRVTDLFIYAGHAGQVLAGHEPYRQFAFEYPPLALVPITLAGLPGTGPQSYAIAFGLLMLAAGIGVVVLTARLARGGERSAAWIVALSPLLTGAMVRTHFDLAALVLALAGLVALTRDRPVTGFALLGAGAMTKLIPALLVPAAVAWMLAGRRPAVGRGLAAFAAVVLLVSLPFLGRGELDAYRYQLERPVQIESTPATVLFALGGSRVTGTTTVPDRHGSNGLVGGTADAVEAAFAVLLGGALAGACLLVLRAPADARSLILGALAALLAFLSLGKVLSPQFMTWLVPFAALAWAMGERALALALLAAVALTQFEFPARYLDLVREEPGVISLVALRNAVLLGALVLTLARLAARARSRPRASVAMP